MTKFEEMIGDTRIFALILEDFFKDWHGTYDVMPAEDTESRLFKRPVDFTEFCKKVRSTDEGYRACLKCDAEHAHKAATTGEPISYICHAGLLDIAVPIIVDGNLVATIMCGQSRSWNSADEQEGQKRTRQIEQKLGIPPRELQALREKTPVVSKEQVEDVKSKLWEVATYVSTLGSRKVEAEKAKRELAYRLKESEAIQEVMHSLAEVVDDLDEFWRKLDGALASICSIIGAAYGILLMCEKTPDSKKPRTVVYSIANLSSQFIRKVYHRYDPLLLEALQEMRPKVLEFRANSEEGTLCHDISLFCTTEGRSSPDEVALVPLKLGLEREATMVFFLLREPDKARSLSIEDELKLLTQAGTQIATAYENCQIYEIHNQWLENISHQLLSPLNEILGQAENLFHSFKRWQQDKPERIENALETLMELSDWAARLASNFAWIAAPGEHAGVLNLQLENDIVGRLIGYARNVQGMGRALHLFRVHVDKESVSLLNGKVQIERTSFKQAFSNLLDNAVKYAYARTEVTVHASLTDSEARIYVTDYGIPIKSDEIEKIFDRGYRTNAAKAKNAIGTGIGLTIARDIIRLHGGTLSVEPSTETSNGWKTTFTITLPIIRKWLTGGN